MNVRDYERGMLCARETLERNIAEAYTMFKEETERLSVGFFGEPGDCMPSPAPNKYAKGGYE